RVVCVRDLCDSFFCNAHVSHSFRLWLVVTSIVASVAIVKRASRGLEPRRLPVWLLELSVDCDPFRTGQVTPEQRAVLVPKREVGEPVIGGVNLDHLQP